MWNPYRIAILGLTSKPSAPASVIYSEALLKNSINIRGILFIIGITHINREHVIMFNEIATSRRFRGWKFGANIGFWPRESFALNFRCGVLIGLFESSGDNNAYTANDKTQHCKYCGNPSKQLTSHLAAGTCYIQRSKCQQQGYERHGEQHSPFQCRRRERAQHHQDAVYKCRNGEFRAVTRSAGELRIIQNLPNLLGLCSPSSGLRRIGGCRCGQKCRIKNRQEFSGPSATIITGHVQFDGRPVSTLSAGFQRELSSVI